MATSVSHVINRNRVRLIQCINISDTLLLDTLIARRVISTSQAETIRRNYTNHGQASALLDYLSRRPESDLREFIWALQDTDQSHVAALLTGGSDTHGAPSPFSPPPPFSPPSPPVAPVAPQPIYNQDYMEDAEFEQFLEMSRREYEAQNTPRNHQNMYHNPGHHCHVSRQADSSTGHFQ